MTDIPVWAQAAAAVLVLGVAAGAANLQVKVATDGVTVNTGWLKPVLPAVVATDGAVSQQDLRALAVALRQEMESKANATSALVDSVASRRGDEVLNKARAMLAASEQKQGRELGIGISYLRLDVAKQREIDLRAIDAALRQQSIRMPEYAMQAVSSYAQKVNLQQPVTR